jgi:alpha-1,6-mannosyltransferase
MRLLSVWLLRSVAVVAFAIGLTVSSGAFCADANFADGRVLWLAAALFFAGLIYVLDLKHAISHAPTDPSSMQMLLVMIALSGLAARVILFASTPILEDDFQRYLWDGAVTAYVLNPYAQSPSEAQALADSNSRDESAFGVLAREGASVLANVNHPNLKTIYPPVAQGAFAIAHMIAPWSLTGWRLVCLAGELATFALLLMLLQSVGRSPLWVALYWWNPLVMKELMNSAHMEAVLIPFVFGAVVLAVRQRFVSATVALGFATGVKVWPLLLVPLLLRPLVNSPRQLLVCCAVLAVMCAVFALPVYLGGLDETSGFVAYVSVWQTNSALFPAVATALAQFLENFGLENFKAGSILRAVIAIGLAGFSVALAWRPWSNAIDLLTRSAFMCGALVLLSPAQFPWYMTWVLPLAVIYPALGLLSVTAFVPLYYASFHFYALGTPSLIRDYLVWMIWIPIWTLILRDVWRSLRGRAPAHAMVP